MCLATYHCHTLHLASEGPPQGPEGGREAMGCEGSRGQVGSEEAAASSEGRPGPPGICQPGGEQERALPLGGNTVGPGRTSCFQDTPVGQEPPGQKPAAL